MLAWLRQWQEEWKTVTETARAGAEGERLARKFLKERAGYRIVVCNWRSPRDRRDEIDLVCRDGAVLVFVEVKARSSHALVSGYHAVDKAKKRVLLRACRDYLGLLKPKDRPQTFRFDVVEVERGGGSGPVVRHFENVPLFPKNLSF